MIEKGKQGFASMSPEKRKEVGRKGALSAHAKGVAYQFTSEKAREAALIAQAKRKKNLPTKADPFPDNSGELAQSL